MPTFHIIFPGGNQSVLRVLELPRELSHKISEYLVASRHTHTDLESAVARAKALAIANGLDYEPFVADASNVFLD